MAAIRNGGEADNAAAVPLAHGRAPGGAAESPPSGNWIEHGINALKPLKILDFLAFSWYN